MNKNILGGDFNNRIDDLQNQINQNNNVSNPSARSSSESPILTLTSSNLKLDVLMLSINNNNWIIGATRTGKGFFIGIYKGDNVLFIDRSHNVGIGTNTPVCKLDIKGDVSIQNNLNIIHNAIINNLIINTNATINNNLYVNNTINNIINIKE